MSNSYIQTDSYTAGGGSTPIPSGVAPTLESFSINLSPSAGALTCGTPLWTSTYNLFDFVTSGGFFHIPNPAGSAVTFDLVLMIEQASPKNLLCIGKASKSVTIGAVGFTEFTWNAPVSIFKNVVYWVGIQQVSGAIQVVGSSGNLNPNVLGTFGGQSLGGLGNLSTYVIGSSTILQNTRPNTQERLWYRLKE